MSSAIAFAPLVLLPVVLTLSIKGAAWVFKRTRLDCGHALVYGLIAGLVNMVGMVTARMPGRSIPLPVFAILCVVLTLVLGAWYLGPRARTADGAALRFPKSVVLCVIAWVLLCAVSVAIFFAAPLVL